MWLRRKEIAQRRRKSFRIELVGVPAYEIHEPFQAIIGSFIFKPMQFQVQWIERNAANQDIGGHTPGPTTPGKCHLKHSDEVKFEMRDLPQEACF